MDKPKILILGSAGMLGHMVYRYFNTLNKYILIRMARSGECEYKVDLIKDPDKIVDIVEKEQPDYIINCIGLLVKDSENNPANAIFINSLFPHLLEGLTKDKKIKIIHISTDCVFSGTKGNYSEDDCTDGIGYYAKTKALGELKNNKDLTIRTSIIGPELKDGTGLLGWFLKQQGEVKGYSKCLWNGVTTLELAKQLDKILSIPLVGLYQLVPNFFISKYDLLKLIKEVWKIIDINIVEDMSLNINKTLTNTREREYNPNIPSYETQLKELKDFTCPH
jgi:dTDP-4-dehydrorhamnose reductase